MTHVTVALKAGVIDDAVVSRSLNKRRSCSPQKDAVNKCIDGSPPQLAQSLVLVLCLSTAGKPKSTRSKRIVLGDYHTPSEACLAHVRASAMVASRGRGPLLEADCSGVWHRDLPQRMPPSHMQVQPLSVRAHFAAHSTDVGLGCAGREKSSEVNPCPGLYSNPGWPRFNASRLGVSTRCADQSRGPKLWQAGEH